MDASSEICCGAWALAVGGMTREIICKRLDMFIAFSLRMLLSLLLGMQVLLISYTNRQMKIV